MAGLHILQQNRAIVNVSVLINKLEKMRDTYGSQADVFLEVGPLVEELKGVDYDRFDPDSETVIILTDCEV